MQCCLLPQFWEPSDEVLFARLVKDISEALRCRLTDSSPQSRGPECQPCRLGQVPGHANPMDTAELACLGLVPTAPTLSAELPPGTRSEA